MMVLGEDRHLNTLAANVTRVTLGNSDQVCSCLSTPAMLAVLSVLSTLGAPGGMRALAMADGPTFYRYVSMMEGGAAISPPFRRHFAAERGGVGVCIQPA